MMQEGVPGARWQTREQMHLTLRFIGEVDGSDANAIDDALSSIRASKFTLQLKSAGAFGSKIPRALWAGIAPNEALTHLQRKIETALQRIGLEAEQRKFVPHVTLARLRATPPGIVMDYLVDHALFAGSPPFEVRGVRALLQPSVAGGQLVCGGAALHAALDAALTLRQAQGEGLSTIERFSPTPSYPSIPSMSSSDSPKWCPISWISTWRTMSPSVSWCSAQ